MGLFNKGDRITSEITIGYKTTNSKGVETIVMKPTTIVIADQSQKAASAHLLAILNGIAGPAKGQVA